MELIQLVTSDVFGNNSGIESRQLTMSRELIVAKGYDYTGHACPPWMCKNPARHRT